MMLTALETRTWVIIDLTAIDDRKRQEIHGVRNRKRHGHDLVCKMCHRPVHPRQNHHGRMYFAHDPGRGECVLAELARHNGGMTPEHMNGTANVAAALRKLQGWQAALERVHPIGDTYVRFDVEATYTGSRRHERQRSAAFEVQLAPITTGEVDERSERGTTASGLPVYWLTPHLDRVGDHEAMICDPGASMINDRILLDYEPHIPSAPLPIDTVIRSVFRPAPGHRWFQAGEYGEFYVVHIDAFGSREPPGLRFRQRGAGHWEVEDRDCDRDPVLPGARLEPPQIPRERPWMWTQTCCKCDRPIPFPYGGNLDGPHCLDCWEGGAREEARRRALPLI